MISMIRGLIFCYLRKRHNFPKPSGRMAVSARVLGRSSVWYMKKTKIMVCLLHRYFLERSYDGVFKHVDSSYDLAEELSALGIIRIEQYRHHCDDL